MTGAAIEVWRGSVPAWECDEMGHMNVGFYLAHAMQGLAGAAAALGMPNAFGSNAAASLVVRGCHIRFLREARGGAPLHMTAGVLSLGENDAVLLLTLIHSRTGETAATFVTRLAHVTAHEGRSFPWPERSRQAAKALSVALPGEAGPRGLGEAGPAPQAVSESAALRTTGRTAVTSQDCDVFGRMRPEMALIWLSQAIPHLAEPYRAAAQAAADTGARIGGAALEHRLTFFGAPAAGDLVEIRSGFAEIGAKTARMRHWLIDPRGGAAWAAVENVSVNFDLDARKAVVLPAEAVARLQTEVIRP